MPKKKPGFDFEQSIHELEKLVETMENGGLSLEESLQQFERGVNLIKTCQKTLREAEQKVQILLQDTEDAEPTPLSFEQLDQD